MSCNMWDNFKWSSTSSTASNCTAEEYRKQMMNEIVFDHESKYKWKKLDPPSHEEAMQYVRGTLGPDEKKEEKPQQTIFHFDPEGIVNEWSKKRNDNK